MVISISVVSIFADDIAVEHPGRNLQDTRDVWHIDYEPRKAAPFSDECDTRYQKVSLTTLRRWDANGTNALSPTRVADNNSFYEDILVVTEFIELQDRYGVTLASDLVTLETTNNSYFWISDELMENNSLTQIRLIYKFENDAMHHWWLPDGYDVCIFGTNDEGQDLFSKILYGSKSFVNDRIHCCNTNGNYWNNHRYISGYFGGRTDEVIMRITDIFFAVPGLILALAFVAALQAIDDFTLPLWFAFLLPLSGLCIYFRSTIFDSIMPGETSFRKKSPNESYCCCFACCSTCIRRSMERFLRTSRFKWMEDICQPHRPNDSGWDIYSRSRLMDDISLDGVGSRTINSLDWRNPYRYLTFRTLVIFIASIALFTWSEMVIMKSPSSIISTDYGKFRLL